MNNYYFQMRAELNRVLSEYIAALQQNGGASASQIVDALYTQIANLQGQVVQELIAETAFMNAQQQQQEESEDISTRIGGTDE